MKIISFFSTQKKTYKDCLNRMISSANHNKKNNFFTRNDLLNWLVGPYKEIYTGYATDKELRYGCSSGGIATALLQYLLKTKKIDGAIVVAPVPGKPLEHQAHFVDSAEEVVKYRGTIYCQVDLSPTWQFIQKNNFRRMAVVGQPCQLRAVDHFISLKGLDSSKIFKIGLFCGGISSRKVLRFLCRRKNIELKNITGIRYRSGGWPGRKMVVNVHDPKKPTLEKEVVLFDRDISSFQKYLYDFCFSGSFFSDVCKGCKDQTAERADISLGDAWLPEIVSSDKMGTNIIIVRTDEGQKIIYSALNENIINLNRVGPEDVLRSQGNCLVGRKLGLWGKLSKGFSPDVSALIMCRRFLPQYIPSQRMILERNLFQWLAKHFPTHPIFILFIFYNLTLKIVQRFKKMIIFIFKIRKR